MPAARTYPHRRRDEGVALVLALVFVVLLAALVTEFTYGIQVDATLIGHETSETDAYLAARSAISVSESVLAADLIIGEDEARQKNTGVYDSLDEPWASGTPVVKYNDAMVTVQISDEYGKINLNALIYEDSTGHEVEYAPLVEALRFVFEQVSVDSDPVDAILDWLDSDDTPRPNGFERDYYEKLDPPITCKNGPMDSLEELLLIPGVSQEMYFAESDKKVEPPMAPMSDVLTVHGHPEGRVNINTAPAEVLDAMFAAAGAGGASGTTEQVMKRRQDTGPYTSLKELRSEGLLPAPRRGEGGPRPGPAEGQEGGTPDPNQPELFDVKSSVFRIYGDSSMGDVSVRVEVYVWRDTPQDDTVGRQAASGAAQMFRIIDWRLLS
jgi:general secretion pathway protein K